MRTDRIIVWALLALTLLAGCKGSQLVIGEASSISARELVRSVEDNRMRYDWFAGRARMQYDGPELSQSFSANIRIRHDSIIWLSLTGFLGIEGARAKITPDSLFVIDKLNARYVRTGLERLSALLPVRDVDFELLESLLTGNALDLAIDRRELSVDDDLYRIDKNWDGTDLVLYVLPEVFRYRRAVWQSGDGTSSVEIGYDDYRTDADRLFAFNRTVRGQADTDRVSLDMRFSRVRFDAPTTFPFTINERYERMDL